MKFYTVTVKHLIGNEERVLQIPKVYANSFCMACAVVESQLTLDAQMGEVKSIKATLLTN